MQKWEFKFIVATNAEINQSLQYSGEFPLQNSLSALGAEGWQLVSVVPYTARTIFALQRLVGEIKNENI